MSRTFGDSTRLQSAKQAILSRLTSLSVNEMVVVIAFNSTAKVSFNGSASDQRGVADALGRIRPEGGTDLLPALELARPLARRRRGDDVRMIVVTDGEWATPRKAARSGDEIIYGGIRITVLAITQEGGRTGGSGRAGINTVTDPNELDREMASAGASPMIPGRPGNRLAFTAAHTNYVRPGEWGDLVFSTHLDNIAKSVKKRLESDNWNMRKPVSNAEKVAADSVLHDASVTVVPNVPGLEFNPPRIDFRFLEEIHFSH